MANDGDGAPNRDDEWRPLAAKNRGLLAAVCVLQLLAAALAIGGAASNWWTYQFTHVLCVTRPVDGYWRPVCNPVAPITLTASPLSLVQSINMNSNISSQYSGQYLGMRWVFEPEYSYKLSVNHGLGFGGLLAGGLFCLLSSAAAFSAAKAASALARPNGPMPRAAPPGSCACGCYYPSMPALNGLGWCGFLLTLGSSGAVSYLLSSIQFDPIFDFYRNSVSYGDSVSKTAGPGVALAAISVALNLCGSIFFQRGRLPAAPRAGHWQGCLLLRGATQGVWRPTPRLQPASARCGAKSDALGQERIAVFIDHGAISRAAGFCRCRLQPRHVLLSRACARAHAHAGGSGGGGARRGARSGHRV